MESELEMNASSDMVSKVLANLASHWAFSHATFYVKWKELPQWVKSLARRIWFIAGAAAKEHLILAETNAVLAALGKVKG